MGYYYTVPRLHRRVRHVVARKINLNFHIRCSIPNINEFVGDLVHTNELFELNKLF